MSVIELLLLFEKEGMEIICIEPHRDKEHPDLLRPSVNLICSTRRRGHTRDVWQQTASAFRLFCAKPRQSGLQCLLSTVQVLRAQVA